MNAIFYVLFAVLTRHYASTDRHKTIYQKIQNEPQYASFHALTRSNRIAKLNLHYESLTVFVAENQAFNSFNGEIHSGLAFYHMSFEVKTLKMIRHTKSMETVNHANPPLWFTSVNDSIYVNNAKILQEKSDYVSKSRTGDLGKQQVLHMIDKVLDPMITSPKFSPNAYDFLSSSSDWDFGASKLVTSFYQKVQEHNLLSAYKAPGGHTFFIPLDSGIDSHKFKMISDTIILGHIIPDRVLFTRPTEKGYNYKTLANNPFVSIALSFQESNSKVFVRGLTRGDLSHGDFFSEIIIPNIPVKNGVIHLISQPLGVFNRTLKPFPYLPIIEKITSDPELDVFYQMGERTGFNKIFLRKNASFTYFIPKDKSWTATQTAGLEPIEDGRRILSKHLVVSSKPYSMDRLVSLSRANNYTDIVLNSEGGPLEITAFKIEGEYYIKWSKKYLKVVKADYECTNGMVHVLIGPMVNFRQASDDTSTNERLVDERGTGDDLRMYWNMLKAIFS